MLLPRGDPGETQGLCLLLETNRKEESHWHGEGGQVSSPPRFKKFCPVTLFYKHPFWGLFA